MIFPEKKSEYLDFILEVVKACTVSSGSRQALAQYQSNLIETGRGDKRRALVNKLSGHCDRLASYLFSPDSLRFHIGFERHYEKDILAWAEMASRLVTKEWKRKNIDLTFSMAVEVAVKYGAAIFKLYNDHDGVSSTVIMPWQFGVYDETRNSLAEQEAVCETGFMNLHDVWRRIQNLPDADKLYKRICANASKGIASDNPSSFFHQVVSSSVLNTSGNGNSSTMGGMVTLAGSPGVGYVAPEVDVRVVKYHQLYIRDDFQSTDMYTGQVCQDYTTALLIEPDVLVTPSLRRSNLWAPKTIPYSLVQPNIVPGYFWGKSETSDLEEPQMLLAEWMDDIRRIMGNQYDKLLAFTGYDGISDEVYAASRASGYFNGPPGSSVNDITPKLPSEALQVVEMLLKQMEDMAGFGNILSGQGEPGVRAGNHAESLIRTASPRLRDRSLIVERQCSDAAEKTLAKLIVVDGDVYQTANPSSKADEAKEFQLHMLPEDWELEVDSHSSSPVYEQDHKDMTSFGLKAGIINGQTAIEMLPFPNRDLLVTRYHEMQANKAVADREKHDLALQHPEAAAKLLSGKQK